MIRMRAKFRGVCQGCAGGVNVGEFVWWDPKIRRIRHERCKSKTAKRKLLSKARGRRTPASRPARGSVRLVS